MTVFSTADFDPKSMDSSGLPLPGKCHLLVIDTIEKEDTLEVLCVIKAHEKPGQENKKLRIWFKKDGKSLNRAFSYLIACGVVTKEEIIRKMASGNNVEIPFEMSRHRDFMTNLEASTYQGKAKVGVEFTFVNPKSPEAQGYPRYDFEKSSDPSSEIPF